MPKKHAALVMGSTENYFFATGTVVANIRRLCPDLFDDILIFYDTVKTADRSILEAHYGCTLIPYTPPPALAEMDDERLRRFTPLSFSIYEIFRLLDAYRNILWLDGDVCVQGDIRGIFDYGPAGLRFGGTSFKKALGRTCDPAIDDHPTCNTGVVYVNDSLPDYLKLYNDCYRYTKAFSDTLHSPDQGIINYVLWKNNITVTDITKHYNYAAYHDLYGYHNAAIFHMACDYKFWDHWIIESLFPLWTECYREWLGLGGSAFTGPKTYPNNGSHFTMLHMATQLGFALAYWSEKELTKEQEKTITSLESKVEELLQVIKVMNRGAQKSERPNTGAPEETP